MRITRVVAEGESRRRAQPIRDALQVLDTHGTCRVSVETDEGVTGQAAIAFGGLDPAPGLLARLIDEELAPAVAGEDPFMVRAIRGRAEQGGGWKGVSTASTDRTGLDAPAEG